MTENPRLVVMYLLFASAARSLRPGILAVLSHPQTIIYSATVVAVVDASVIPTSGRMAQDFAIGDGKLLAVGRNGEIRMLAGPPVSN